MATRHQSVAEMEQAHDRFATCASKLASLVDKAHDANQAFTAINANAGATDAQWEAAERAEFDTRLELEIALRGLGVDPAKLVEALT